MQSVEIDKGAQVTLEPLWINRILLARALRERRSFGRVVKEAFQACREEEMRRLSIMEYIEMIAETPFPQAQKKVDEENNNIMPEDDKEKMESEASAGQEESSAI